MLDEPLTPRTLVASAVIVVAVAIIVTTRTRLAPAHGVELSSSDPGHARATGAASVRQA
jgi:hypothetical protein